MSTPSIPRGLNPQQRETVRSTEGAVLVLAGAGTGKTRTVTERIAYLLKKGVPAEHILAVTFTNKAAAEMKERVQKCVRKRFDVSPMIISTFHSLCVRILRRDAKLLGYRRGFTITDQGEQLGIVRKAARHVRGAGSVKPDDLLYRIGQLKNAGVLPEAFQRRAIEEDEQTLASVYRRYQDALRMMNAFDFDDLLLRAVELLESHEEARSYWAGRFQYVMVDEFQDTNAIQCRLVDALQSKWRNLCVVGDDDQSIYGWRGAVADNILGFERQYENVKVIRLEENYRSTNAILRAANAVIEKNEKRSKKTLWSSLGDGIPVRVFGVDDQQNEAERVAAEIKTRVGNGDREKDFAVIVRTNAQTRPFEEELQAQRLRYAIIGGKSFFDRKEVRDVLAYLAAVANPYHDAPLLRIINTPARGIGDKTLTTLGQHAQQSGEPLSAALGKAGQVPGLSAKAADACQTFAKQLASWRKAANGKGLADLVDRIVTDTRYREEVEHLYDDPLEQAARLNMALDVGESLRAYLNREPEGDLAGFVQEAALWGRDEESSRDKEEAGNAVKLITAHSAKGLEFPFVYIAGVEEGLIPHKNHEESDSLDEERRLFYVGMTRAQRELTLLVCRERLSRGKRTPRAPSRFIGEIPKELLDRRDQELTQTATLDSIRAYREKMAKKK